MLQMSKMKFTGLIPITLAWSIAFSFLHNRLLLMSYSFYLNHPRFLVLQQVILQQEALVWIRAKKNKECKEEQKSFEIYNLNMIVNVFQYFCTGAY